jgi:hypothetical protein
MSRGDPNSLSFPILRSDTSQGAQIQPMEWVRRYGIAEIAGTVAAVTAAHGALALTGSEIAGAYGGTVGEGLGFYGVMVARELLADHRAARAADRSYSLGGLARTVTHLAVEFGPAELADSGVVRPLAMAAGSQVFGLAWGVLIGKIAADLLFYVAVISAHELRAVVARPRIRTSRGDM